MTVYRFGLAAVAAVALVVVAPEANGGGGTPITFCNQPVSTNAVLVQDLNCTGDGIGVIADGITINLNGHTLTGDRTGADFGVSDFLGFDKVKVENGVVRNFDTGVEATGVDQFSIVNVVAVGDVFGFDLRGNSISVVSSNASGNQENGIQVIGNAASVKSTFASGNGLAGIVVNGDGTRIASVTASGNTANGVAVHGSSVSVKSSNIYGNGDDGLLVDASNAQLTGNKAVGNGFSTSGHSDFLGLGIRVNGATPIGKNTARGNDDPSQCFPTYLC